MFHVIPEPRRNLVRITLSGMLTAGDVAEMARQEQAAARAIIADSGDFALLVENQGTHFQTQQVMQSLERLLRGSPFKARRLAVVCSSAASKMQARRLSKLRDGFEIFDDAPAALEWLAPPAPRSFGGFAAAAC